MASSPPTNSYSVDSVDITLVYPQATDNMAVDGVDQRKRKTIRLMPLHDDPYSSTDRPAYTDAQGHNYRIRAMVKSQPELSIKSLSIEAVTINEPLWYPQLRKYRQELPSSQRLTNLADVMLLFEALRMGPSDAVEDLQLDNFEFIVHCDVSGPWRAILARLPNLKVLRLAGSGEKRHLVGSVSPFPLLLGSTPGMQGALQNVTNVFIDNVRCSTLSSLLSHLNGLSALEYLSLSRIKATRSHDPAEPPAWHHHFDQLTNVTIADCEDTSSLGWLYASPTLVNRLHEAQTGMPHIDPFLAFLDARYIVLCLRALCEVHNSPIAKVQKHHKRHGQGTPSMCGAEGPLLKQAYAESYQISFMLLNGVTTAWRMPMPITSGMGEWAKVDSHDPRLDELWQQERHRLADMLSEELRATGQLGYTQEQITRGCTLCKHI